MDRKKITIFVIIFLLFFLCLFYFKTSNKKDVLRIIEVPKENSYSSNVIENVKYSSSNANGNEYIITAKEGEIDLNNNNIIFLTNVKAIIKLRNSNEVLISSNFGKYNINNFDTIFSKNVIINYLENKINGEYLDFSIKRNSMIISQNVIYSDANNILKTDNIEINLKTKDTKFFMYDKKKKITLESKN